MYTCFKCGVSFSSQQALNYHQNKKIKCLSLECATCKQKFSKKGDYKLHVLHCGEVNIQNVKYNNNGIHELILTNGLKFISFDNRRFRNLSNKES